MCVYVYNNNYITTLFTIDILELLSRVHSTVGLSIKAIEFIIHAFFNSF